MREQVSKIEMYKKSMNNNYRKIHLSCLFVNEKRDFSFSVVVWWPIPSSLHRVYPYSCLYTLRRPLCLMVPVIIVSGSMGIFSDGKGDLQDIGDKLG